ncbi:MAG: hypothetical protein E3J72_06440 [Planctomycetota bacterium]|nr:MAG: hypothetical protein E3J72_06440 [Planctomycetota bacterium]
MRAPTTRHRSRRKSRHGRLSRRHCRPEQVVKYAIRIVTRAGLKNSATDSAIMGKGKRPPIILDGIPPSGITSA